MVTTAPDTGPVSVFTKTRIVAAGGSCAKVGTRAPTKNRSTTRFLIFVKCESEMDLAPGDILFSVTCEVGRA